MTQRGSAQDARDARESERLAVQHYRIKAGHSESRLDLARFIGRMLAVPTQSQLRGLVVERYSIGMRSDGCTVRRGLLVMNHI